MNLNPYTQYYETNLIWLKQIPIDWKIVRAKNVFTPIDIRSESGQEELLSVSEKAGVTPRKQINVTMFKAESYVGYKLCWEGDLVINSLWAWMQGLGFSKYHGIISSAYGVYRLKDLNSSDFKYFDYLLRSNAYLWELRVNSKGIWRSRYQLTNESFFSIPIVIPPEQDRKKIARYLDWKTAQIAKFIKAKKRLIDLLKEQKHVIINDAVTGKIDVHSSKPYSKYKDSGVEWLGLVPEEWQVIRIKNISRILRGKFNHRPRNDTRFYDGEYPFIQTGDVARAGKYLLHYNQTLNKAGYLISKEFPKGTLVMTIAANIGEVSILEFDACFPDSIVGFIPANSVDLNFLYLIFLSMRQELIKQAPVNTQGNLNIERIGAMFIPLPVRDIQTEILLHIEKQTKALNHTIVHIEREIELIQEYRTRLISDVVTGKIDVRDIAIPDINKGIMLEEVEDSFEIEEDIEEAYFDNNL